MLSEQAEKAPIIQMKNVTKTFGQDTVLQSVNVEFAQGQIHGLVGRNGSGKTVLMKCICGLLRPTSGCVRVRGQEVGKDVPIPPDLGAIIDSPGFLPNCNGYKNLAMLYAIRQRLCKDAIETAIMRVGLDPKSRKHVGKYSLGMRQRLGIAQTIMENPSILLLDEPMNGLDNRGVEDMRALFHSLREEGKTILLASHNPLDIDGLCDTVCEMDAGVLQRVR